MKKALIAGAASTVLAAMSVVSTFAAEVSSVVDDVQLTVSKTCKMEATDSNTQASPINLGSLAAGNAYEAKTGTAMTITCNANAGWNLKAKATALSTNNGSGKTDYTIPFGAYTEGSQATSVWSAQIALTGNNTGNATIQNGFGAYNTVSFTDEATEATIVAQNVTDKSVSGLVITPSYIAYTAADQAEGTYYGTITYTFTDLTN